MNARQSLLKRLTSCWLAGAILAVASSAFAAGGGVPGYHMEHSGHDMDNVASLQRGSKMFVNYCLGCHSAEYVRYNRVAADLQISAEQLEQNLMFTAEKSFETMRIAMPPLDSKRWFGRTPPDLSLIARSRGADWVYNYLRTFYVDESGSQGVNNLLLPNAAMPHALWELEGFKRAVYKDEIDAQGNSHEVFERFETVTEGSLDAAQYDDAIRDLVNFLDYIGEPVQLDRRRLGVKVLAFLLIFFVVAYALKREMWKDVK